MCQIERSSLSYLKQLIRTIRERETEFIGLYQHIKKPTGDSNLLKNVDKRCHFSAKILKCLQHLSEEKGKVAIKFWIEIKKIMSEGMEKAMELEKGLNKSSIVKCYQLILYKIETALKRDPMMRVFYSVEQMIRKKFQQLMFRSSSLDRPTRSMAPKSKYLSATDSSKKKKSTSVRDLINSVVKQRTTKKSSDEPFVPDKEKKKGKEEKKLLKHEQNRRLLATTTRLNRKLFKDLDLQCSVDRFDCARTRKVNSAVIFGDMMMRNAPIQKEIDKFCMESMNKTTQAKSRTETQIRGRKKVLHKNSLPNPPNPQSHTIKTVRKTQNYQLKKKKISNLISIAMKLPSLTDKKTKEAKTPATLKVSDVWREEIKIKFPKIWKTKNNNSLFEKFRQFEMNCTS